MFKYKIRSDMQKRSDWRSTIWKKSNLPGWFLCSFCECISKLFKCIWFSSIKCYQMKMGAAPPSPILLAPSLKTIVAFFCAFNFLILFSFHYRNKDVTLFARKEKRWSKNLPRNPSTGEKWHKKKNERQCNFFILFITDQKKENS